MKYSLGCRRSTRADVLSAPQPFSGVKHLPCNRPPPPVCREKISEKKTKKKNVLNKGRRILNKYLYTVVTWLPRRNMNDFFRLLVPTCSLCFQPVLIERNRTRRAIRWRANQQNYWITVFCEKAEVCWIIIQSQNEVWTYVVENCLEFANKTAHGWIVSEPGLTWTKHGATNHNRNHNREDMYLVFQTWNYVFNAWN